MAEPVDRVLDQLPIHPHVAAESEWQRLRVDCLVAAPFTLSRDDLTDAGQGKLTDDFRCTDGWVVPGLRWEGVPATVLLDGAGPLPEAAYVAFSAGEYNVGLTVEQASEHQPNSSTTSKRRGADNRTRWPVPLGRPRLVVPLQRQMAGSYQIDGRFPGKNGIEGD